MTVICRTESRDHTTYPISADISRTRFETFIVLTHLFVLANVEQTGYTCIYTACCSHLDGLLGDKQDDFVLKIRQQEALAIAGDHDVVPVVFCAVFRLRNSVRKNGVIDTSMN
jgi:hypothetical protein